MSYVYEVPERHHCLGKTRMAAFRVSSELYEKITTTAVKLGWTVTDVMLLILDQFVRQAEDSKLPDRPVSRGAPELISMRVPKDLLDELGRIAKKHKCSVTELVVTCLHDFISTRSTARK